MPVINKMRVNILFLMLSLNMGGTEKHVFDLISNLNREKFNPSVCCLYDLGPIGTKLSNLGFQVYHNLMRSKWDVSILWKLPRIFSSEKIHILYTVNSPLPQFLGSVLSKIFGVGINITRAATTGPVYHRKRRKIINKMILPLVDKVIAQADSHKEFLVNTEGFRHEKIKVIYNGIDLKRFDEAVDVNAYKKTLRVPPGAPLVGIVARLSPEKELHIFLRAAKKIISVVPHVHFLIVGDGEERKKLEIIAHELKIPSNVHFLGTRVDIPQIVSLFDIGVLTSNREAFPNVILEYMAASKPVVATDVGSASEIVIDGKSGYVVPYGDSEAVADAILRLLRDRSLAREMGDAGRKAVEKKFTIQTMMVKYESLFLDSVKGT